MWVVGDLIGCDVIEVGFGFGGLICGLLVEGVWYVLVIEKDVCVLFVLVEIVEFYLGCLYVINGDVLEIDFLVYLMLLICIVVNLFYNVGMELLICWLIFVEWLFFW